MIVISGENVNTVFNSFLDMAKRHKAYNTVWRTVSPRGMETIELNAPVSTVYREPLKRVLFDPERDANPFFHLMESLWILGGRKDVAFLAEFNKQMKQFSDDGETLRGAYGNRLIPHGRGASDDQIDQVCKLLLEDPDSRRGVLSMWNPELDQVTMDTKDLPCNVAAFLKIRDRHLQMTVCCRSNDALLGCYGANVVHFSILQEYLAARIGVWVGAYTQISDSLHIYTASPVWARLKNRDYFPEDRYGSSDRWGDVIEPYPLVKDPEHFDDDLQTFFEHDPEWAPVHEAHFTEPFFTKVVIPMLRVWYTRKAGMGYYNLVQFIHATDWRLACLEWCERRDPKLEKEENLGYS